MTYSLLAYEHIRQVHVEASSFCNARCPLCPRNVYGINDIDLGYTKKNLALDEFRRIFDRDFLSRCQSWLFNGNFGDSIMNPDLIDILDCIRQSNTTCKIQVTTNGGARDQRFWSRMAELRAQVTFSIDGLEDTNHLYRQDVNWHRLMTNAQTFIKNSGDAIWKCVLFQHNKHQIHIMRHTAQTMGFRLFEIVDHRRDTGWAFDNQGRFSHCIGNAVPMIREKVEHIHRARLAKSATEPTEKKPCVQCVTQSDRSIYVNASGEVYPCCWWGFATGTFESQDRKLQQIRNMIKQHNAIIYGLEHAMQWFQNIPELWKTDNYLETCHATCGTDQEAQVMRYKKTADLPQQQSVVIFRKDSKEAVVDKLFQQSEIGNTIP